VSSWKGGTGLEGNSRGNPVMSHGLTAGQASDQANEGGQAGAGSTGDMSLARHAKGGQACKESPGATRHQPWPVPVEMPGTDMPRLTGTLMARRACADLSDLAVMCGHAYESCTISAAPYLIPRYPASRQSPTLGQGRGAGAVPDRIRYQMMV